MFIANIIIQKVVEEIKKVICERIDAAFRKELMDGYLKRIEDIFEIQKVGLENTVTNFFSEMKPKIVLEIKANNEANNEENKENTESGGDATKNEVDKNGQPVLGPGAVQSQNGILVDTNRQQPIVPDSGKQYPPVGAPGAVPVVANGQQLYYDKNGQVTNKKPEYWDNLDPRLKEVGGARIPKNDNYDIVFKNSNRINDRYFYGGAEEVKKEDEKKGTTEAEPKDESKDKKEGEEEKAKDGEE
jgi:hypothetical protein